MNMVVIGSYIRLILQKKQCLIISLFVMCIQSVYSQGTDSWISVFSENDQHEVQELSNEISSLDTDIYIATQTFDYDSIDKLFNLNLIQPTFNSQLAEKKDKNSRLIEVYSKYIDLGKQNIDSVPDYKISLEYSYGQTIESKSKLNTLSVDNISQLAEAKSLLAINQTQENIIFNQKQFFTFFAIAGKSHLLSNKKNASLNTTPTADLPNQSENTSSESFQYANVIINEEIVESIKVAISEYEYDSNNIYDITNFDIDNLNKIWESYVYEEETIAEELTVDSIPDIQDTLLLATNENSDYAETESEVTVFDEEKSDADPVLEEHKSTNPLNETTPSIIEPPKEKTKATNNIISTTESSTPIKETINFSSGLVYRVQIAADRVPLSERKLQRRYKGNRQIVMFQEEGWYKYYIAETKTLKEAIIIKKESNVPDAFVMAYKDGVKVQYYLKYQKAEKGSVPPKSFIDLKSLSENKIVIVVQVAADREPLTEERLSKLYQGGKPLNYIFEDGWHKYSFGNYQKFWPANMARRKCGVKDAFVVAYKNGKKHDLWKK